MNKPRHARELRKPIGPVLRRKCRTAFRRSTDLLIAPIDWTFGAIDSFVLREQNPDELPYPVLFIVGPPRCGSTLALQLIVSAMQVAYINNLMIRFPSGLAAAGRLFGPRLGDWAPEFSSRFGISSGFRAPAEGGKFWRHHFHTAGDDVFLPMPTEAAGRLRATIGYTEALYRGPFVAKFLAHSLNVETLARVFPEAMFVTLCGNPLDIADSIIRMRGADGRDKSAWMSIRPPGFQKLLGESYVRQVAFQIGSTYACIIRDREKLGAGRFIDVDYESVCANTTEFIKTVHAAIGDGREYRHPPGIPRNFQKNSRSALTEVEQEQLRTEFERWPFLCAPRDRSRTQH